MAGKQYELFVMEWPGSINTALDYVSSSHDYEWHVQKTNCKVLIINSMSTIAHVVEFPAQAVI